MTKIPVFRTVAFALGFAVRRFPAIAGATALPLLIGWLVMYLASTAYLDELQRLIRVQTDRTATLVLGLLAVGFFLTMFVKCVAVIAIGELAEGGSRGRLRFRITLPEWRLYAANLRFLVVLALLVVFDRVVAWGFDALGYNNFLVGITKLLLAVALLYLALLLGFFMTPVVLKERGAVLRRSWRLVARQPWRVLAVIVLLTLPAAAVELGGEYVIRLLGAPSFASTASLGVLTATMRQILPQFLAVAALAYTVSLVLLTAGAMYAYRIVAKTGG